MIAAILLFIVLALFYLFIPASKFYVLIILGIIIFRISFEPINRWISYFLNRDSAEIYKPLYKNPGSKDFEVVAIDLNAAVKAILFDTKNHNTIVYTASDRIYKINSMGEVIDSVSALSWQPISKSKLPILLSIDSATPTYRDWINTTDSNFKQFTELNADRKMPLSQWDKLFLDYYQRSSAVDYAEAENNNVAIFKIDNTWTLLNSYQNKSGDEDSRFTRNIDAIIFEGFPAKVYPQLISLVSADSNTASNQNLQPSTDRLTLSHYRKESFEWPSCPPGLPLPIAGGFTWSGTGYYDFLHQGQLIKFSLPTEHHYGSGYDQKIYRYYLPDNLVLNSDMAFIEVSESYSQGFGENEIHRDGFGLYVIRKK